MRVMSVVFLLLFFSSKLIAESESCKEIKEDLVIKEICISHIFEGFNAISANINIILNDNSVINFDQGSEREGVSVVYNKGKLILDSSCCGYDKSYWIKIFGWRDNERNFFLERTVEGSYDFGDVSLDISYVCNNIDLHSSLLRKKEAILKKDIRQCGKKYKNDMLTVKNNLDRLLLKKRRLTSEDIYLYEAIDLLAITKNNLSKVNDVAYYLIEGGEKSENEYAMAIVLLKEVLKISPERTVAYINMGDAYWGLGNKDKATSFYETYIRQMKKNGNEGRIPNFVLERVKHATVKRQKPCLN